MFHTGEYYQNEDMLPFIQTKVGFNISDWYLDKAFSIIFNEENPYNNNLKLYGYWIPEE